MHLQKENFVWTLSRPWGYEYKHDFLGATLHTVKMKPDPAFSACCLVSSKGIWMITAFSPNT